MVLGIVSITYLSPDILEYFNHYKKRLFIPMQLLSFLLPHSPKQLSYFMSMELPILSISPKWAQLT